MSIHVFQELTSPVICICIICPFVPIIGETTWPEKLEYNTHRREANVSRTDEVPRSRSGAESRASALLMVNLGVGKTHSRPHVPNDNPYSEAQFRTLKYCPTYPARFGSVEDARQWAHAFFAWYNHEHHHTGLGLLTPADVHYGRAETILAQRQVVMQQAYELHPDRFVNGAPKLPELPAAVRSHFAARNHTKFCFSAAKTGIPRFARNDISGRCMRIGVISKSVR